jgi:hypothetical protein
MLPGAVAEKAKEKTKKVSKKAAGKNTTKKGGENKVEETSIDQDSGVSAAAAVAADSKTHELTVKDFRENHTDTRVSFTVTIEGDGLARADASPGGLDKAFKMSAKMSTSNMVLFDSQGQIKKYANTLEVCQSCG